MTGHAFIQHFIQKEEPLMPRVICHYDIFSSLHMRSPFSFGGSIRSSVYMHSYYNRNTIVLERE